MVRTARKSAGEWPVRWDLLLRYRLIEVVALWDCLLYTSPSPRDS